MLSRVDIDTVVIVRGWDVALKGAFKVRRRYSIVLGGSNNFFSLVAG